MTSRGGPRPVPAAACAGGRSPGEPRLSPDGSAFASVTRSSPVAGGTGATVVVVSAITGAGDGAGGRTVVAADPEPATRGGVLAWLTTGQLAYVTRAGDVAVAAVSDASTFFAYPEDPGSATAVVSEGDGTVRVVATGIEGGASALASSPDGTRLAFVADTRAVCVVPATGGPVEVVADATDFALDPCWSPDGLRLAWHEWDVPSMPWDSSRIVMADATPGGAPPVVVAGGPGVSVQEPRFAPDGSALAFLCDAGGWCNLWIAGPDGSRPRPLVLDEHEHGGPVWGGGQRSFAWSPDSRSIAFTRNEAGFGRLCVVGVATGAVRELSRGVHTSLTWAGGTIACVRSGARTPTTVVGIDPVTADRRVLTPGVSPELEAAAGWMSEPESVEWEADDGAVVHGRLWRPPDELRGHGPPPLLVWLHGGPTDQRQVTFDPRLVFYLSRGWAVLHPDPRGSTGWGRDWAQGLREGWGEVDVADVAAGAAAAVDRGWGDPARLVAMGGSAGAMTALLLAARDPDRWAAVVALYPVVDLLDLAATTHRYEAHYTVGLVGPLPATAERHRTRSPRHRADRITAPVLLLHGSADPVVPPTQSAELAAELRARGVAVEHHVYEGEGHGWRSAATTRDELERTEAFLAGHGLTPSVQNQFPGAARRAAIGAMTTTFCPGCGAEYEHGVAVCPGCGILLASDDALVYEMDGWEPGERAALGRLLADAAIAHRWDGDDLFVPEGAEEQVDGLMDRVEFPDALEAVAAEDDADMDDEAVYAVMSDLFMVADRLAMEHSVDVELAGDLVVATAAASAAGVPYGVEPASWKQVQQLAEGIVVAIEAEADDEVVVREAASLRDLLRRMV